MGQAALDTRERDEAIRKELGEGLPDSMRQSVWELFFAKLLTCNIYGVVWLFERRRQLEQLSPRSPLRLSVPWTVLVAVQPLLGAFERFSPTALAAILSSASLVATLAFNYRFMWTLRWRAERFGLPLQMGVAGWLGWFFFGEIYLQSKINQLARMEQALARRLAKSAPTESEPAVSDAIAPSTDPPDTAQGTERAPRRLKNKPFWDLIDLIDREPLARGDDVTAVSPLRASLANAPLALRCAFHETLAQKLYAFDGPMFATAAGPPEGDEDRGLLARAFVVASGQARYREVLATPEEMPRERTEQCGALLTVAKDASLDAGEAPFVFAPSVGLATGSNAAFWKAGDTEPAEGAVDEAEAPAEPRRLA